MIRRELAVFLVVGSLTVLVDFLSYSGMRMLGLDTGIAKGAGFLIGTLFAYCANRAWTFGQHWHAPGSAWRFVVLYSATLLVNVAVNALGLYVLDKLAGAVMVSFLVATSLSAALNFIGMKWFVFRPANR